ncbi:unnamed protein product [Caenorhabditis bovis]|uniref:protein-tyrosine-phosphatase n=1 Tax=Caenorhabditis bovis TaxID=2654633 RepID=A0A8S1EY45_9PELO|nr:unnamed protein product [Caenorhabditis bovis]
MWLISDNLFLSNYQTVSDHTNDEIFKKFQIRKVVSLMEECIPNVCKLPNVEYVFFKALDVEEQELLSNGIMMEAIEQIDASTSKNENVIVHCVAGVSRSVAICMGYLMYKRNLTTAVALDLIKNVQPTALPNSGFMAQLKIFERSGCLLEAKRYQNILLKVIGKTGEALSFYRQPVIGSKGSKFRFKCKKCRKLIFTSENIVHHDNITEISHQFLIEPMAWFNVASHTSNITHSCGAKLGNFIATGSKCPNCFEFVCPWICAEKSKIDIELVN